MYFAFDLGFNLFLENPGSRFSHTQKTLKGWGHYALKAVFTTK